MANHDIVVVDIDGILNQLQDAALTAEPLVQIEQAQAAIAARLNDAWAETEHLPEDRRQAAQAHITQVWNDANDLATQAIAQTDLIRQAGAATAVLVGQRDRYADELSDLSEAVYNTDTEHPAVSRLADEVEQNTMSWYGDMVDEDMTWSAINSLMGIDGATQPAIRRFLDRLIRQDGEWTDEQEFLLAGLLGTFVDARDRVQVRR